MTRSSMEKYFAGVLGAVNVYCRTDRWELAKHDQVRDGHQPCADRPGEVGCGDVSDVRMRRLGRDPTTERKAHDANVRQVEATSPDRVSACVELLQRIEKY